MKAGETGVLAALVVFLAGGLFVGLSKMPEQELFFRTPEPEEELSVYEQLKLELRPYHFGNLPKSESFRGDTTVLSADMDYIMYSVPQIDLHITRLLRNMEFTGITAAETVTGGIVFKALFPNGQPLEIWLNRP